MCRERAEEKSRPAESTEDGVEQMAGTPRRESKRLLVGLLAILVGYFGIHKFVLGYTREGIVQIVFTIITFGFGGLISLVEGILYLTRSDDNFYYTYQVGKRSWF